jgi:hypothetical protein
VRIPWKLKAVPTKVFNLYIVAHCEGGTGELGEKQAAATYELETVSSFASRQTKNKKPCVKLASSRASIILICTQPCGINRWKSPSLSLACVVFLHKQGKLQVHVTRYEVILFIDIYMSKGYFIIV